MRWKKFSNFIIVIILSLAYVFITFMNVIGPLHMNAKGGMNGPGILPGYGMGYLIVSLVVTWTCYLYFQKKTETVFFLTLIVGIIFLIIGAFLWHLAGG